MPLKITISAALVLLLAGPAHAAKETNYCHDRKALSVNADRVFLGQMSFAPNSKTLAFVLRKNQDDYMELLLWDIDTDQEIRRTKLSDTEFVYGMMFSGDGSKILVNKSAGGPPLNSFNSKGAGYIDIKELDISTFTTPKASLEWHKLKPHPTWT